MASQILQRTAQRCKKDHRHTEDHPHLYEACKGLAHQHHQWHRADDGQIHGLYFGPDQ